MYAAPWSCWVERRRRRYQASSTSPIFGRARVLWAVVQLPGEGVDLDALVNEYEGDLLLQALRAEGGVKKRAARRLGISFRSFRYRLEKLGLDESKHGSE